MTSVPPAFVCPLTQDRMTDPVVDPDGNSYERVAIEAWLSHNPTSPVTRTPLTPSMLAPNRALKDMIEAWLREANETMDESDDGLGQSQGSGESGETKEPEELTQPHCTLIHVGEGHFFLETPQTIPLPTDLCLVIDVSGSMCARTTTSTGEREETNLSVLDVVRHAAKTLATAMKPEDRLAIVTFSTAVTTLLPLTSMDVAGKASAFAALDTMCPTSSTNLWGGISRGLEAFDSSSSEETSFRNAAMFVLTDGMPNVTPPRGEEAMTASRSVRIPVHTFGFGYDLDSRLLVKIAEAGQGSYSFIPDAGMVGTIFVHAWANLKTTVFHSVKANGHDLGDVRLGARRHAAIPLTTRLAMEARVGTRCITLESAFPPVGPADPACPPALHGARQALYSILRQPVSISSTITSLEVLRVSLDDPVLYKHILDDLDDQVAMALSREDWFRRWGRHYLPSLAMAHRDERCNNFKDPGVAFYADPSRCSPVWTDLRNEADAAYLALPAPTGSLSAPRTGVYATQALGSMATYHDPDSTCVTGLTLIEVEGGEMVRADRLTKGDRLMTPNGPKAIVGIVKTECTGGKAEVIGLSPSLFITLWHPVLHTTKTKWAFPIVTAKSKLQTVEARHLYSFILEEGGYATKCGDYWVATLGSLAGWTSSCSVELQKDSTFYHPFFSTSQVLEALEAFPSDPSTGTYSLPPNPCSRDPETTLINGFIRRP